MSFTTQTYRVVIASPSDMDQERVVISETVHRWNALHAESERIVLLPSKWETDLEPQMAPRPQEAINDQLIRRCDILIGMFWTRLGTHTGVAESGTVEEIDLVAATGKPCLLYFSDCKVKPSKINTKQLAALREFKNTTYERAIVGEFNSLDEITTKIEQDLLKVVRKLKEEANVHIREVRKNELGAIELHHYSVAANDLNSSIKFYRDVLGLREIKRAQFVFGGAWFKLPNGQELHVVQRESKKHAPHYRCNHLAFRVSNFRHAYDWLKEHWHSIETYPTLPTGFQQLYIRDPDGNIIEINSSETIEHQNVKKSA